MIIEPVAQLKEPREICLVFRFGGREFHGDRVFPGVAGPVRQITVNCDGAKGISIGNAAIMRQYMYAEEATACQQGDGFSDSV